MCRGGVAAIRESSGTVPEDERTITSMRHCVNDVYYDIRKDAVTLDAIGGPRL